MLDAIILVIVLSLIGVGILKLRKHTRKVRQQMMDEMKDLD